MITIKNRLGSVPLSVIAISLLTSTLTLLSSDSYAVQQYNKAACNLLKRQIQQHPYNERSKTTYAYHCTNPKENIKKPSLKAGDFAIKTQTKEKKVIKETGFKLVEASPSMNSLNAKRFQTFKVQNSNKIKSQYELLKSSPLSFQKGKHAILKFGMVSCGTEAIWHDFDVYVAKGEERQRVARENNVKRSTSEIRKWVQSDPTYNCPFFEPDQPYKILGKSEFVGKDGTNWPLFHIEKRNGQSGWVLNDSNTVIYIN